MNTPTSTSTLQVPIAHSAKEGLRLLPKVDDPCVTDERPFLLGKPTAAANTVAGTSPKKRSTSKHIR